MCARVRPVGGRKLESTVGAKLVRGSENDDKAYARAVAGQLRQFPNADGMHALPPIFWYWVERHLCEKARGRIPSVYPDKFFSAGIIDAVSRTGIPRVLSVGAGDATQEILIAKELCRLGHDDIEILCADLTPALVADAAANIEAAGLSAKVRAIQIDLNKGFPLQARFGAVIAIDVLHHILNLEGLFQAVEDAINPDGSFIFRDVIGRNGHMRWPEVLKPLRSMWTRLPLRLRYNHMKSEPDLWFENFDCSVEGFEGIRAQDIMGLLADRFDFEQILTYGGLTDVFIDRAFGPNLDPQREEDRQFIDSLQMVEDNLAAAGSIKPTQIYAVARRRGTIDSNDLQEYARKAVRDPIAPRRSVDLEKAGLVIPYPNEEVRPTSVVLRPDAKLAFADRQEGAKALRWGWHAPEATHVWSYREDSAIGLRLDDPASVDALVFETIGYVVDDLGAQVVTVHVNEVLLGQIVHTQPGQSCHTTLALRPEHWAAGKRDIVVQFDCNYSRRPDRDGGADARPIGFVLLSVNAVAAPGGWHRWTRVARAILARYSRA
jgi:SAM-dependent methyltransferase